jgi:hypothetical protein
MYSDVIVFCIKAKQFYEVLVVFLFFEYHSLLYASVDDMVVTG